MTVTISLSETVANKENYRLEYSKDNRNWSKYVEGTTITMTQNGKIYARTKDIAGDIKTEGGYAEGEVTIIDKEPPTAGTLIIKLGDESGENYIEGTVSNKKVYIEPVNGTDNEGGSGHKSTVYNVEGPESYANQTGTNILKKSGTYTITITTTDNVNLPNSRIYTIEIKNAGIGDTVDDVRDYITGDEEEPTTVEIAEEEVVVPPGFTIAEDSGKTVPEGIVVKDKQDNEWVWIPCYIEGGKGSNIEGRIEYDRRNINSSSETYSGLFEGNPLTETSDEYKSIKQYGGYYIARYESGRENSSSTTVLIQQNKLPYNIKGNQVIQLSEGMTSVDGTDKNKLDGTKVFTKLCSSYSWDTAILFIEKTHPTYGSTSKTKDGIVAGNYNSSSLKNTGLTTPVCSIYDMGGNMEDFTSERYYNSTYNSNFWVDRGGSYNGGINIYSSAGGRGGRGGGESINYMGFRVTLFVR